MVAVQKQKTVTLKSRLEAQIRSDGPLTIADYMSTCLFDPEFGYYRRPKAIGAKGAFTTAPEMTQMFGELIGLFLARSWVDQGRPSPLTIAELGPGRGVMMADILRSAAKVSDLCDAADLVLLESSPTLRDAQSKRLSQYQPVWIDQIKEFPDQPLFLIANEFFDALPIRQFRRTLVGWNEIVVDLGEQGLEFSERNCLTESLLPRNRRQDTEVGDIVEIRPQADVIVQQISELMSLHGGTSLIIDYGNAASLGDTVQSVMNHAYTDIFAEPGKADITAHVDFGAIRKVASPVACTEMVEQGIWLKRMGMKQRTQILAQSMDGDKLRQHLASYRRLTHPKEMGSLFKVMALYPKNTPLPAGFSE